MNTLFWLIGWSRKKSPTTNKETPPNGNEFCMIAFNPRSKCPEVFFLSLIFHLLPKLLNINLHLFLKIGRVSSLSFSYLKDFNLDLEYNVMSLKPVAVFPLETVTSFFIWLNKTEVLQFFIIYIQIKLMFLYITQKSFLTSLYQSSQLVTLLISPRHTHKTVKVLSNALLSFSIWEFCENK